MKASPNNPIDNRLPQGVKESALIDAVAQSGYPLQGVVARQLQAEFSVAEEWDYIDDHTQEHRNIDLLALKQYHNNSKPYCSLELFIECKRSRHPFVFFRRIAPFEWPRFPVVAGIPNGCVRLSSGKKNVIREATPASVLGLPSEPFIAHEAPECATMSRARLNGDKANLSGDETFREIVQPLVKSLRHAAKTFVADRAPAYPTLLLCIAVLDAPMLFAGDPATPGDLQLRPWVRVVRREPNPDRQASHKTRFFGIDVVHAAFLETFISKHLLPFGQVFAERSLRLLDVLSSGGVVDDLQNWSWADIRAK